MVQKSAKNSRLLPHLVALAVVVMTGSPKKYLLQPQHVLHSACSLSINSRGIGRPSQFLRTSPPLFFTIPQQISNNRLGWCEGVGCCGCCGGGGRLRVDQLEGGGVMRLLRVKREEGRTGMGLLWSHSCRREVQRESWCGTEERLFSCRDNRVKFVIRPIVAGR